MLHRLCVVAIAALLGLTAAMSAFSASSNTQKKRLPLDNVPGAVLKTRVNSEFLTDRIVVKLNAGVVEVAGPQGLGVAAIDAILSRISVLSVEPMFPQQMTQRRSASVDLSRFYVVRYSAPEDPFSLAEELSALQEVHYAEPWFIYPISYDPNDPFFGSQYGLTRIQAPAAWDISQGDTSVVIGIVDSGVQTTHPDLSANIWHNPGETGLDGLGQDKRTNGVDDDANGYVDDWQGWDFGGADYNNVVPDNNPNPTDGNNAHGTHVAGIASAATDNGIGVAGTGFKCRLLPVKTSADNDYRGPGGTGYIIAGIQGIAYAAAMGANVMNCSWGGGGGSQVEQEIITWATELGTLIVAAAGNSNSSAPHYPSAYQGVISVSATDQTDHKASYSNYGHTVDVAAPGDAVYSTYFPNTYATLYGTSMASPHAAGAAAIIGFMNPSFSAMQVGEQMRVTSDNINGINPSYTDLLGKGRVNMFRALTETSPSVRPRDLVASDSAGGNNNGNLEPNEIIDLFFTFTNYLAPTSNASVTLTETSTYISVVQGSFTIGALNTLDTVRNTPVPLQISIAGNVPAGHIATCKLTFSDGSYSDYYWFTLVINPTFQNHDINDLHVTMTNNGRIGYNDFPNNTQGIGVLYPSTSLTHEFEGGLIIGTSATKLVNNIRNPNGTQDNDFRARTIYEILTPGVVSNQDGYTWYSDSLAPIANRIGVRLDQYTYAYSTEADTDYIIMRYEITNLTSTAITGLRIGHFHDWDIANYATNRTGFDQARNLAYAWDANTPSAPYLGVRALDSATSCRGLINSALTVDRAAKWAWISGGTGQSTVGPGDIHFVIASGPYTIDPGETQRVGFAIIGGVDLADVQTHADAARVKWDEITGLVSVGGQKPTAAPEEFALLQNYPNPFNPATVIRYDLPAGSFVTLKVYDILGREVTTLVNTQQSAGSHSIRFDASSLPSGMYLYQLRAGSFVATRKFMLLK